MKQNPILIPEITRILCTLVDFKDLLNLALTCRALYHASCSRLWKTLNPKTYRTLRKIKATLDNTANYNKFIWKFSFTAREDTHHLERFFFNSFLFPNLRDLEFSYAGAQDQIVSPMILAATKTLRSLNLSQCYCLSTNAIRPLFGVLQDQLKSLILYGCGKIDLEVVADIIRRHSNSLTQIRLTDIDDNVLDAIRTCRRLTDLGLEHCNESSLSVTALNKFFKGFLDDEVQLSYLRLRDIDSVTSDHLRIIAKSNSCVSLVHFDMSECNRIKPAGVSWIATECINLKTLSLAYQAGVTDQAMQLFFYNCHQLKHVDVSGCRLLTDTAFVPLFEAEEDRAVKVQLETLNVSGLDLLSASLIHYILSKLDSLQELCLGVTYDLDEADSILETMNNMSETTRFYMDTEKYYTICKIRNREIFASSSDNVSSGLSTSTRATTVNINRMLVLPSSSTWSLPPPLFPL